jgi:predicted nuclease with TOPRIM domain
MQNRTSQREFRRRPQEEAKKLRQELSQLKEDHSILSDHAQTLQAKLEETETSHRGLLAAVKLLKMEFCMPLFPTEEE